MKNILLIFSFLFFYLTTFGQQTFEKPSGLICEFLGDTNTFLIEDAQPEFGWIMNSSTTNTYQAAYEILVASSEDNARNNKGDMWSSGCITSGESSNVEYHGKPLLPDTTYYWKVRVWNQKRKVSEYSDIARFKTGSLHSAYATSTHPLTEYYAPPLKFCKKTGNDYFIDFGKDAFGTIMVDWPDTFAADSVEVRLSEALTDSVSVDVNPPGTIRAFIGKLKLKNFQGKKILELPGFECPIWAEPDEHVPIPHSISNIMPFRYCELLNVPGNIRKEQIKRVEIIYPFHNDASFFTSSNDTLNRIWDLCKYTIRATTYCGVYVDGDRERKPYEADAYINQLGHYCTDREYALARYSYEYFFEKPTWPTEWKFHSILMAWQDYMYTGNSESLKYYYEKLTYEKLFLKPVSPDGLIMDTITIKQKNDIIDWPACERDGYDLKEINMVVNAFYYGAMVIMSKIADVIGKSEESKQLASQSEKLKTMINSRFMDTSTGLYIDAIGSKHSSLHANMFAMYFGLAPENKKNRIITFIKTRGMACSVYGAQYLLDMLYAVHEGDYAMALLTSTHNRSWWNMLRVGSTLTLEAWDITYKPNLDWNHAWGAAPANIIPRGLFGIQPTEPGFKKFEVKPQTANLTRGRLKLPTIKGNIIASFEKDIAKKKYVFNIDIPANTSATVYLPALTQNTTIKINNTTHKVDKEDNLLKVELKSGQYTLVVN